MKKKPFLGCGNWNQKAFAVLKCNQYKLKGFYKAPLMTIYKGLDFLRMVVWTYFVEQCDNDSSNSNL